MPGSWSGLALATPPLQTTRLRAKPRDRRNDVVEIKELFELGRQLMDRADQADTSTTFARALLYRDGLIIALLAADPLRSANITALEIGRTLIKDGTTWSLNIPAEETKPGRLHLAVLPDWSVPCIDRYVHHYRPMFRNAQSTSRLWLSRIGRPLDGSSLYKVVCKRTREAFGKQINPHLFRSCLATSTAVHHGAAHGAGHDRAWASELEGHDAILQSGQDDRRRAGLSRGTPSRSAGLRMKRHDPCSHLRSLFLR